MTNSRQVTSTHVNSASDATEAEVQRLRQELARMTSYAQALEVRCNRLWTWLPDTHGTQDPIVPFVARYCDLRDSRKNSR